MDKPPEENIEKTYADMGRGERRRIFKANKKFLKGMTFTEFNAMLPKRKEEN